MSLISGKVHEVQSKLKAQNEMIMTLRNERKQVADAVKTLYSQSVKFKAEYATGKTPVETGDYPEVRGEDMSRMTTDELVKKLNNVMGVMAVALGENRSEIHAICKSLDDDLADALDTWDQIRLAADQEKKPEAFRANLMADAAPARSQTPELVVPHSAADFGPALPPTPPSTAGKKEPQKPNGLGKQKGGTTTLDNLMSPTGKGATASKATPKK